MHAAAPWLILLFSASSSTTKSTSFNFFFCCLICVCICFVSSEPNVRAEDLYRTGTVMGPKSTQHMFFFIRLKPMEYIHPIAIVCLFSLYSFHPMQKSIDLRSVTDSTRSFGSYYYFFQFGTLGVNSTAERELGIFVVLLWNQSRRPVMFVLFVSFCRKQADNSRNMSIHAYVGS